MQAVKKVSVNREKHLTQRFQNTICKGVIKSISVFILKKCPVALILDSIMP